jgi:putative acetyltransferase
MSTAPSPVTIRPEEDRDHLAIYAITSAAFNGGEEADLIDRLRQAADPFISLVAELEGRVVGHILFTSVTITGPEGDSAGIGLAPMAVAPGLQRQGIGSALVESGLEVCREAGHQVAVVLGHPQYYPRFGFERASAHGIRWEIEVPEEAFMVLELAPGALVGRSGVVRYHPEFGKL